VLKVTVDCRARNVTVKGPRGTLTKSLKHLNFEASRVAGKPLLRIKLYHGAKKQNACIRTVCSHIQNMIVGVTQGFRYKMRYAYAHFPITVNISESDRVVEIRNFLGEKLIRRVSIHEGVTVEISSAQKDELILTGNSIENVSQTGMFFSTSM
jgi:large subunit ribosomal protein L9e